MLSLQSPVQVPDTPASGHPLGIDLGLDKFLATSDISTPLNVSPERSRRADGELIERPKFLMKLHSELKLLQRRLKLKVKGSANRYKLNQKIARLHQKISDTRKDFHFKLAHHLCDQAGMIFVEDLDFRTWAKGMLGKHTLDAGFGRSSPGSCSGIGMDFVSSSISWLGFVGNEGYILARLITDIPVKFAQIVAHIQRKVGGVGFRPAKLFKTAKKTCLNVFINASHASTKSTPDVAAAKVIVQRGITEALADRRQK